jgi:hypothetical protein
MSGLLIWSVDSLQPPNQPTSSAGPASKPALQPTTQPDYAPDKAPAEPATLPNSALSKPPESLWRRQWLFLRRRWWNVDSLTFIQRLASFLRGVILIAVGAIGLIIVVNNTLNLNASGMDAIAKLMAEFLLIPVGLLALIIAGYGLSQIVRSFIPNAVVTRHALDHAAWEEEHSEEFQLRDEDQP